MCRFINKIKQPKKTKRNWQSEQKELIEEVNFHRQNEVALKDCIKQLQKELCKIAELNNMRRERNSRDRFVERTVEIEKRLGEQEQYSRRECVKLVGLPEDIHGEDLEVVHTGHI